MIDAVFESFVSMLNRLPLLKIVITLEMLSSLFAFHLPLFLTFVTVVPTCLLKDVGLIPVSLVDAVRLLPLFLIRPRASSALSLASLCRNVRLSHFARAIFFVNVINDIIKVR